MYTPFAIPYSPSQITTITTGEATKGGKSVACSGLHLIYARSNGLSRVIESSRRVRSRQAINF